MEGQRRTFEPVPLGNSPETGYINGRSEISKTKFAPRTVTISVLPRVSRKLNFIPWSQLGSDFLMMLSSLEKQDLMSCLWQSIGRIEDVYVWLQPGIMAVFLMPLAVQITMVPSSHAVLSLSERPYTTI